MTPETIQKLVAGTLVVGGIGGGFYALTGGKSATLQGMHLAKGRELEDQWDAIETAYKNQDNQDLIDGIANNASKLQDKIKNWCKTKGNTYFTNESDKTYQSYSIWCLKKINLETELTNRGFKWKEDNWDKKLEKYKTNLQSFLAPKAAENQRPPKPAVPPKDPTAPELKTWCQNNKSERFKYTGEDKERQVRLYCYWSDSEIEAANKPSTVEGSPSASSSEN